MSIPEPEVEPALPPKRQREEAPPPRTSRSQSVDFTGPMISSCYSRFTSEALPITNYGYYRLVKQTYTAMQSTYPQLGRILALSEFLHYCTQLLWIRLSRVHAPSQNIAPNLKMYVNQVTQFDELHVPGPIFRYLNDLGQARLGLINSTVYPYFPIIDVRGRPGTYLHTPLKDGDPVAFQCPRPEWVVHLYPSTTFAAFRAAYANQLVIDCFRDIVPDAPDWATTTNLGLDISTYMDRIRRHALDVIWVLPKGDDRTLQLTPQEVYNL